MHTRITIDEFEDFQMCRINKAEKCPHDKQMCYPLYSMDGCQRCAYKWKQDRIDEAEDSD
jgi:hypothetical protein